MTHCCRQKLAASYLKPGDEAPPTGSFEAVPDGPGPADAVDQGTVHVTPEVVRPVFTLLVHQTKTTADHLRRHAHTRVNAKATSVKLEETPGEESHLFHQSDPGPAQVSLIHHLHPHLRLEGDLHAVLHLKKTRPKTPRYMLC